MQPEAFIRVEGLSKSYGQIKALRNLSFEVRLGELFGFIGPDGAGKTSLFRILASLLLPDTGSAYVNGLHVGKDYKMIRRITGYMPGRFSLYQDLSVIENLEFFARVFGTSVKENYELIRPVFSHLEPFKNRLAGKLSGGMKQKLALSCALIHRPQILILDEPTTGVDAVSRKEFWDMLHALKKQQITMLVSTPYMDEAGRCDRVALIQEGEILGIDTPAALRESYPHALYALRADDLYGMLKDLRLWKNTRSAFAFGQEVHLTVTVADFDWLALETWLLERKHQNIQCTPITAGVEDCFMELLMNRKT